MNIKQANIIKDVLLVWIAVLSLGYMLPRLVYYVGNLLKNIDSNTYEFRILPNMHNPVESIHIFSNYCFLRKDTKPTSLPETVRA